MHGLISKADKRKQKEKERKRRKRCALGMIPHEESASRQEPWKLIGVSRATYYRTKADKSVSIADKSVSTGYAPLSSIWDGKDGELIDKMMQFYASIPVTPILDATYNTGRIWNNSMYKGVVVSMDINASYKPDFVCDNRLMTDVPSNTFGIVVYDPPHVGPQGRDKSKKNFDTDFGAIIECNGTHDWNLSYIYPDFLKQARRVLKPHGLLLAKITDIVNCHRSKWPHCDFMRMATETGFTVCDLIIKVRKGPMISNKWEIAHHARKRHCFWIICRNGNECEKLQQRAPKDTHA
jgi:hypothetical protein